MDRRSDLRAAMAVAAAVVGAGFASGREVVTFFAGLGAASWLGVVVACAGIGYLTGIVMHLARRTGASHFPELYGRLMGPACQHAMHLVYGLLALLTGAAMLAAGGELGALALPIQHARPVGLAMTLIVAAFAAHSGVNRLAALGMLLTPCVMIYYIAMLVDGPGGMVPSDAEGLALALPMGLLYAAFNAAMAGGTACLAGRQVHSPVRAGVYTAIALLAMLIPANAALLSAGEEIQRMVLPSVVLAARWGVTGYYASIMVMWMAVVTTLCAMLCSIGAQLRAAGLGRLPTLLAGCAGMALFSMYGFEALVGIGYPLMGWVCALALVALPIFIPDDDPA